jgi:hypothetical protein
MTIDKIVQQRKFSIINKLLGYPDPRIDLGNSFLADVGTYLSDSEYHSQNGPSIL